MNRELVLDSKDTYELEILLGFLISCKEFLDDPNHYKHLGSAERILKELEEKEWLKI